MAAQGENSAIRVVVVVALLAGAAGYLYYQASKNPKPESTSVVPTTQKNSETDSGVDVGFDRGETVNQSPGGSSPQAVAFRKLNDAKALAGTGKHKEALTLFEEVAKSQAGTSFGWNAATQAAVTLAHLGQYDEALKRLDGIIAKAPAEEEGPRARLAKAEVLSIAGRHDESEDLYNAIVVDLKDTLPYICEDSLEGLGQAGMRGQRYAQARAAWARLIEDYPGAEDSRKRYGERNTKGLDETIVGIQKPVIEALKTSQKGKLVESLEKGVTKWTEADSPYVVTARLTVAEGDTLQIEAGAVVRFAAAAGIEVKGKLQAAGTADKPIRLLPLSDDATRDWWTGIEVAASGNEPACALTHTEVLGGDPGIQVRRGAASLANCKITRCGRVSIAAGRGASVSLTACEVVDGYRIGVAGEGGAKVLLADTRFAGLTTNSVVLWEVDGSSALKNCRIEGSGDDAVIVRGKCAPAIEGCQIAKNSGFGVRAMELASPQIKATRLEENTAGGLQIGESWAGLIADCTVARNQKYGVSADARSAGEIRGTVIEANVGIGVEMLEGATTSLVSNRIAGNKGLGIVLKGARPASLKGNDISANTEGGLRNDGAESIDAAGNWWGSAEEAEVAKAIQDRSDKPEWGEVKFRPWLTEAPKTPATQPVS